MFCVWTATNKTSLVQAFNKETSNNLLSAAYYLIFHFLVCIKLFFFFVLTQPISIKPSLSYAYAVSAVV